MIDGRRALVDPPGRQPVPEDAWRFAAAGLDIAAGITAQSGDEQIALLLGQVGLLQDVLDSLRAGVMLDDGLARVVRTSLLRVTPRGGLVRVVLVEGRKRQVRQMFSALGCVVEGLQRVRIGPLHLGDLQPGQHRALSQREVEALRSTVGLDDRASARSGRP